MPGGQGTSALSNSLVLGAVVLLTTQVANAQRATVRYDATHSVTTFDGVTVTAEWANGHPDAGRLSVAVAELDLNRAIHTTNALKIPCRSAPQRCVHGMVEQGDPTNFTTRPALDDALLVWCDSDADCTDFLDALRGGGAPPGRRETSTAPPPPQPPIPAARQAPRDPSPADLAAQFGSLFDAVLPKAAAADESTRIADDLFGTSPSDAKVPFTWGFIQKDVTCGQQRQVYVSQVFGYCAFEKSKPGILEDALIDFTRSLGVECAQPSRVTLEDVFSSQSREAVEQQRQRVATSVDFQKHVNWYAALDYYSSKCR